MTLIGALATCVAVAASVLALRASSDVERRLRWLAPKARRSHVTAEIGTMKVMTGTAAGLIALGASSLWSLGPLPLPIAAYLGFIAPSLIAERRDARRRSDARRAVVTLVEWLCALVASDRPVEVALAGVVSRGVGSVALDASLARVRRDYTLGVPLHDALAREGRAMKVDGMVELATRLERARGLGRGALPLLQDLRDELRAAERAGALQAASLVEGKLTAVLTLCYLPALALLVIVPLFLTLLSGLFG